MSDITVITGADTSHGRSLIRLPQLIRKYEPDVRIIAWDLGLSPEERKQFCSKNRDTELRTFDYSQYPAYFNIKKQAGEYAWKPCIISDVMNEVKGPVCWMDAGNSITGSLNKIRKTVENLGLYTSVTTGSLERWTDQRTLNWLLIHPNLYRKQMRAACGIAFSYEHPRVRRLVNRWKECALVKECIAPEGSSKKGGHRQDQSVLTALIVQAGLDQGLPRERFNWKAHCDCDFNKKSNIQ